MSALKGMYQARAAARQKESSGANVGEYQAPPPVVDTNLIVKSNGQPHVPHTGSDRAALTETYSRAGRNRHLPGITTEISDTIGQIEAMSDPVRDWVGRVTAAQLGMPVDITPPLSILPSDGMLPLFTKVFGQYVRLSSNRTLTPERENNGFLSILKPNGFDRLNSQLDIR